MQEVRPLTETIFDSSHNLPTSVVPARLCQRYGMSLKGAIMYKLRGLSRSIPTWTIPYQHSCADFSTKDNDKGGNSLLIVAVLALGVIGIVAWLLKDKLT